MKTKIQHTKLQLAIGILGTALVSSSTAQETTIDFDIPPQPTSSALITFGEQAGITVLVSHDARNIPLSGLKGHYSIAEAIKLLLNGADLIYKLDNDGIIVRSITAVEKQTAKDSKKQKNRKGTYFSAILAGLASVFTSNTLTAAEDITAINSGRNQIDEVVVTARRIDESMQTVPIAVTAFNLLDLQQSRIESLTDLARHVPSFYAGGSDRDNQSFNMRGIGNTAGGPGVISYFSEVPLLGAAVGGSFSSGGGTGPGMFFDLENVQLLKGPQGTLFGQNSVGGAVLFAPAKPNSEFGGYTQVQFGNYDDREYKAAVNVPIIPEKLMVRIAAVIARRDGYTKTINSGLDLDNKHYNAGRISVLFNPTEQLSNLIIVNMNNVDQNGTGRVLSSLNESFPFFPFLYPTLPDVFAQQQALGPRYSGGEFDPALGVYPQFKQEHLFISDTLTWDVHNYLTIKNIFSYQNLKFRSRQDLDGTNFAIIDFSAVPDGLWAAQVERFTEELQFQGNAFEGDLSWTTGVFYYKTQPSGLQEDHSYFFQLPGSVSNPQVIQSRNVEKGVGVYAQGTYDLSDMLEGLKFTAGLRYTWDERLKDQTGFRPETGACTLAGAVPPTCRLSDSASFAEPSWTIALDYQVTSDTLLYLTTRRGYISGGLNLGTPVPETESFGSQKLTDMEVGIKSDWYIGSTALRTNIAAFYGDYDGIQVVTNLSDITSGASFSAVQNNATAVRRGIELEAVVIPIEGLEISGSYSYLDTYYKKYDVQGVPVDNPQIFGAPKRKLALSVRYTLPLDTKIGEISLGGSWTDQSSYAVATDPVISPGLIAPGFSVYNLNADWREVLGSSFDLSFFMTNVTDETFAVGGVATYNCCGFVSTTYNEPRMYGAHLTYNF